MRDRRKGVGQRGVGRTGDGWVVWNQINGPHMEEGKCSGGGQGLLGASEGREKIVGEFGCGVGEEWSDWGR